MVKSKILFRMSLREIKNNFKQYLALILISFLAVTLFIGLTANSQSLQLRVDTLYEQGNIADIFTYVDKTSEEEAKELESMEGIDFIERRLSCNGYVNSRTASFFIAPQTNKMNQYSSIEKDGERGFLIDEHYKSISDKKVGDTITYILPISLSDFRDALIKQYYPDNFDFALTFLKSLVKPGENDPFDSEELRLESKITGFMMHPEAAEVSSSTATRVMLDSELLESTFKETLTQQVDHAYMDTGFGASFKPKILEIIQDISISDYFNQYLIRAKENIDLNDLNTKITDYFSTNENASTLITSLTKENLPSTVTLESDVKQAEQLTLVFPAIFFIVAILVVLTSLSQLIYRSREDIGTMKAIGIPKYKILFHYIWFGIILCFIGCLFGSIVGPLLIPGIMNKKYDILYNLPSIGPIFPWSRILFCTLLFCLLSGFVSFLVSREEVNLLPVESMRPKALKELKAKRKKEIKKKTPFLLSMRMALRNIITKWSRTFMVIFGVMGCTALLVSGFGIMDTVNYGVDLDFRVHMQSQINFTYGTSSKEKESIISALGDKIEAYDAYMALPIQATYKNQAIDTTITLFENEQPKSYDFAPLIQDGVVLSYCTAEKLNISVGDEMTIIYLGKSYLLKVDALFESSYLLQLYTKKDNLTAIDFVASGADLLLKEDCDQNEIKTQIENLNLSLGSISTNDELSARIREILGSIEVMCNTVKIFAILLAVVVTYNLALLNFNERKRDIATLKVIGCRRWEIMWGLIGEIMILTLIGMVLGLFLGYPLLVTILSVNQTSLFHFLYHIFFETYFYSILISLGSSIIVNLLLGRLASKVDAVMALKSVE